MVRVYEVEECCEETVTTEVLCSFEPKPCSVELRSAVPRVYGFHSH